MKVLLFICMIFTAPLALANEIASPPSLSTVRGEVLEVQDVPNYTYLHIKTDTTEVWAAIGRAPVKKGSSVTVENAMVLQNFKSPSLKKTFKTIYFGNLAGAEGASHPVKSADAGKIEVARAAGDNAFTVEEVLIRGAELKDKTVLVRGKIVKYNEQIMGKNWLHLRDGSGSDAKNTSDLLVTTANQAKVGDIVTMKGIVHTDKDFGAGYAYRVLIEDATLQK